MYTVYDEQISDKQLDHFANRFVASADPYFFVDDKLAETLIEIGVVVLDRKEFADSYPTFALHYGNLYDLWRMPRGGYVVVLSYRDLSALPAHVFDALLREQVSFQRGHVYDDTWMRFFDGRPGRTLTTGIQVDGKCYYFLNANDWDTLNADTKRKWVLRWLTEWRLNDPRSLRRLPEKARPISLMEEYVGRFAYECGPNCFAATAAMVVSLHAKKSSQAHAVIQQWLHTGPFCRILSHHDYDAVELLNTPSEFHRIKAYDVVIWRGASGDVQHAAFAIGEGVVFNKMGQSWDQPWQYLRLVDLPYNDCLIEGGVIEVYRRAKKR